MTVYLEVNNEPKDIQKFIDNDLELPYKVKWSAFNQCKETVMLELNWFKESICIKHIVAKSTISEILSDIMILVNSHAKNKRNKYS